MEAAIENKGVSTKRSERAAEGTNKYRKFRDGALPRSETIKIVEAKYPQSLLRYWAHHPLGALLLRPKLTHSQIIDSIEYLPDGEARRMMWVPRSKTHTVIPDSEELLDELVSLQSIDGLIVILGRLRLRLLLGQTEHIDLYEHRVIDCFPEVLASSLHLSIARHALMQALSDFLDWQCGWAEARRGSNKKVSASGIGRLWPSLWRRFEDAPQKAPTKSNIELYPQLVLQQQRLNEKIEAR